MFGGFEVGDLGTSPERAQQQSDDHLDDSSNYAVRHNHSRKFLFALAAVQHGDQPIRILVAQPRGSAAWVTPNAAALAPMRSAKVITTTVVKPSGFMNSVTYGSGFACISLMCHERIRQDSARQDIASPRIVHHLAKPDSRGSAILPQTAMLS